jgi:hypothetical protein
MGMGEGYYDALTPVSGGGSGGGASSASQWTALATQVRQFEREKNAVQSLYSEILAYAASPQAGAAGGKLPAELTSRLALITGGGGVSIVGANQADAGTALGVLRSQVTYLDGQIKDGVDRLYNLNPEAAADLYPDYLDPQRIKNLRSVLGGGEAARPSYSFQIAAGGQVVRSGTDGSFGIVGVYPELADKNVQVVQNQTTGEATALTFDSNGNVVNRTSLGRVAFPDIDPERKFKQDQLRDRITLLSTAAQVEQAMMGLNLQQRGQIVNAIAQDFAYQLQIGAMTYQEATLNLSRINSAFEQRRLEREQMLKYAVPRASLRTRPDGEVVTRLPFADQISSILTATTGRQFSPEDFEIGVTAMDPEQTARDVLISSAYTSPLPGLMAGLQATRDTMNQLFGQPLGDTAVSDRVTALATAGV